MSKHESWRTRIYWEQVGGLLIEEFLAVRGNSNQARRLIDGIIVMNEKKAIHKGKTYDIKGKDVIIIQTKGQRLGMYLLGQAYFSKILIQNLQPRSVKTVALCGKSDAAMCELVKSHDIEVVVIAEN